MVLSLFDACRVRIRNALENGISLPVRKLPLHCRQPILGMVLMHGTIDEPACLAMLSLTEFLTGSSSLNFLCREVNDCKFLDRVATSLGTIGPDGETLGFNILELHLNTYLDYNWKAMTLTSVVQLIAQCSHLAKLEFNTKDTRKDNLYKNIFSKNIFIHDLLNASHVWSPCFSVLENLEEFSFVGSGFGLCNLQKTLTIRTGCSALKFKKLTSLNLKYCELDKEVYCWLIYDLRETLISLRADGVDCSQWTVGDLLPVPLP